MFSKAQEFLLQPKWGLNTSHPEYQSHKVFWGMQLGKEKFFNKDVFSIVKKLTNCNFKINKILANAQSTLQDGSPHIDSDVENHMTFILYANHTWDYQWGGQTIFFDRYRFREKDEVVVNSEDIFYVNPIPNTAVFFPSNMIHYAVGPNRDFYGMRYTIAFHLEKLL